MTPPPPLCTLDLTATHTRESIMRHIIITAIAATVALTGAACSDAGDADRPTVQLLPACEVEDGSVGPSLCIWDDGTGDRILNHPGGWSNLDTGVYRVHTPTPRQCTTDADCEAMHGAGGYGTTPSK